MQGKALQNTYYELASNKVLRNKEIFDFVLFREVLITSYLLLITSQKILNAILGKSEEVRGKK